MEVIHTIGRRKTSIARVFMSKGKGEITINNKLLKTYFPTATHQYKINQPLTLTDTLGKYNINVKVSGGGPTGQVEAIRLGISRALCNVDEEHRSALKPEGLLTRDPRMVERKKFGQKKARKKFQFSKR